MPAAEVGHAGHGRFGIVALKHNGTFLRIDFGDGSLSERAHFIVDEKIFDCHIVAGSQFDAADAGQGTVEKQFGVAAAGDGQVLLVADDDVTVGLANFIADSQNKRSRPVS